MSLRKARNKYPFYKLIPQACIIIRRSEVEFWFVDGAHSVQMTESEFAELYNSNPDVNKAKNEEFLRKLLNE